MVEAFDLTPVSVVQIESVLFHSQYIEQHFWTNGVAYSPTSPRLGESIKTCAQVNVFPYRQVQQQQKTGYFIILQVYRWITISDHYGFDSANKFSKTTVTKSTSLFNSNTQFILDSKNKNSLSYLETDWLVDERVEVLLKTQLEEYLFKRIVKDSVEIIEKEYNNLHFEHFSSPCRK